jgi:hypothetical protein
MRARSRYDEPYKPTAAFSHVIVSGNLSDVSALRGFLREFFCEDHGPQVLCTRVVILGADEPGEEMESVLGDVNWGERVNYVRGSVISIESMEAVGAGEAEAIFLLASLFGTDGDLETVCKRCNAVD